jgi:lysophospholipase L1-like esterase
MALPLSREARWLFIGDSITDCGRRQCPDELGGGYVRMVRDLLHAGYPAFAPTVINRGISGNKIGDLRSRWDEDVLAHQPDLVSIKIGINDVWHGLGDNRDGGTTIEKFREGLAEVLQKLKEVHPEVTIVLCEPSVIWPPAPAEGNETLQPYIQAVREIGAQFEAKCVVPLHGAFTKSREARPDIDWAPDGVHPRSSGHMLIARTWLAMLGLL